jgi:Subtilase family
MPDDHPHDHPGHDEDDQRARHGNWWDEEIAHYGPGDGGEGHYHYMRDQLIVTDQDLERVLARLEELGIAVTEQSREARLGVVLLKLDPETVGGDEGRQVPALVDVLHDGHETEVVPRVAPNHVLGPCTHVHLAGSAPAPTRWRPEDVPLPPNLPAPGAGVTVGLLDTGVLADTPWFRGRVSGDPELEMQDPYRRLLPNCGHGTFVAGVVMQHAPGVEVIVDGVFSRQTAAVNDYDVAVSLLNLFDKGVDVVNMSIGAYSRNNRGMLAFERALDYVTFHRPDMVLVAAAGNDGLDRPCFPAADKRVIGVGAVQRAGRSWRRADFSDYGWWVDACALGVDLDSTFLHYHGAVVPHHDEPGKDRGEFDEATHDPCGAPTIEEARKPELDFEGTATWSGTSFAAPIVAAAVAVEMSAGRTGPEAVRRVIGHPRRPRLHNLGTLVNPKRFVLSR